MKSALDLLAWLVDDKRRCVMSWPGPPLRARRLSAAGAMLRGDVAVEIDWLDKQGYAASQGSQWRPSAKGQRAATRHRRKRKCAGRKPHGDACSAEAQAGSSFCVRCQSVAEVLRFSMRSRPRPLPAFRKTFRPPPMPEGPPKAARCAAHKKRRCVVCYPKLASRAPEPDEIEFEPQRHQVWT